MPGVDNAVPRQHIELLKKPLDDTGNSLPVVGVDMPGGVGDAQRAGNCATCDLK